MEKAGVWKSAWTTRLGGFQGKVIDDWSPLFSFSSSDILHLLSFLYMVHAFMCVCGHVQVYSPMYGLREPGVCTGCHPQLPLSSPNFLKHKVFSSLNLELSISTTLTGWWAPGICQSPLGLQTWAPSKGTVLGFQTQVLQLPSPSSAPSVANKWWQASNSREFPIT